MQQTCSQSLILFVGVRPYGGSTLFKCYIQALTLRTRRVAYRKHTGERKLICIKKLQFGKPLKQTLFVRWKYWEILLTTETMYALRCIRANIATVEQQYYIFWVCVCSHRYPPCKAHAPCHLWRCRSYNIFSSLFHKRHYFRKKVIEHETRVLISSTIFSLLRRYDQKRVLVFVWRTRYYYQIVMKLDLFRQIFWMYWNIKFHQTRPVKPSCYIAMGERVKEGQRNRQPEMTRLVAAFRNFANESKITSIYQPTNAHIISHKTL